MMTNDKIKTRDISIDWIKFFSVFLVINSHADIMYPQKYSILATGGAIGDCLFLFVSGYTLWLNRDVLPNFVNYYKRRVNRIYPSVIVWTMIILTLYNKRMNVFDVWGGEFVVFIMIYYVALYIIRKFFIHSLKWVYILWSAIILLVYWLWFPYKYETGGMGMYGISTLFRWLPFFLFILMGAHVGNKASNVKFCFWKDCVRFIMCLCVFYGVQFVSKKHLEVAPYQIFTLLPLAGIVFYLYKMCNAEFLKYWYERHWVKVVVMSVGGLCLESYIIQLTIITDKLNFLFPFNLWIITIAILIASYLVRCMARLFLQTFDSRGYDWKAIVKVY